MKLIIKNPQNWEDSINVNNPVKSHLNKSLKIIWYFMLFFLVLYFSLFFFSYVSTFFVSIDREKDIFWDIIQIWYDKNLTSKVYDIIWNNEHNVIVINSNEQNAYAALWWNIFITDILLRNLKYEEELLFIIWHENSHINNRDAYINTFTEIPFILITSLFFNQVSDWVTLFSSVKNVYSKNIELRADRDWLKYVFDKKNHVWCVKYFFENWLDWVYVIEEFFSTHPITKNRIKQIDSLIEKNWYEIGECKELNL